MLMFSKPKEQGRKVFGNYIDLILTWEQAQEKTSTAAPFDVSSYKMVSGCDIQTSSSGAEDGFGVFGNRRPAALQSSHLVLQTTLHRRTLSLVG